MKNLYKLLLATASALVFSNVYSYPDKPITMVMAWGAGGATDVLARAIQPVWSKNLGVNIIIKNVTGAAGTIGTAEAAGAKPDGYTILVSPAGPLTTQPHLRALPYSLKSFEPLGRIAVSSQVLMVSKTSPYKSAQELFEAIKAQPGELIAASNGGGSLPHIGIVAMNQSDLKVKHLPFKGSVDSMRGLLGNTVQLFSDQVQLVESFDVRPLATWSSERLPEYPDVPTMTELGYDYQISNWVGAFAPVGTPPEILEKLVVSLATTLKDAEVIAALDKMKIEQAYLSPAEFGTFAQEDAARNKTLLQAADLLAK